MKLLILVITNLIFLGCTQLNKNQSVNTPGSIRGLASQQSPYQNVDTFKCKAMGGSEISFTPITSSDWGSGLLVQFEGYLPKINPPQVLRLKKGIVSEDSFAAKCREFQTNSYLWFSKVKDKTYFKANSSAARLQICFIGDSVPKNEWSLSESNLNIAFYLKGNKNTVHLRSCSAAAKDFLLSIMKNQEI